MLRIEDKGSPQWSGAWKLHVRTSPNRRHAHMTPEPSGEDEALTTPRGELTLLYSWEAVDG